MRFGACDAGHSRFIWGLSPVYKHGEVAPG